MEFVTPPLRRVVLRNGPAGVGGALEYAGAQGCYLDAKTPAAVTPKQPSRLSVRAHAREPRVILLRFTDIPTTGTLRRATLEMTTDPSLQADPGLLQELAAVAISCNSIRDDWDPATATFTDAAAGKPWGANELIAGGTFHSKAGIQLTIRERRTLSWDVTEAVRAARQSGKTAISLLVRIDYTGKYVDNLGYEFCGHDFPRVEKRPRLRLDVAP